MFQFSKTVLSILLLSIISTFSIYAQEIENSYNSNSVRPVRRADVMLEKSVWVRTDLRQKQNEPFFAANNQIAKVIIDAVKSGVLRPFHNDSLNRRMTLSEFEENLKIPGAIGFEEPEIWGSEEEIGWETDTEWDVEEPSEEAVPEEFFANQLYEIEIKKEVLFDRKRSRQYDDIQSVSIIIPAEYNPTGIEKELASFSYKELVENVFENNPTAIAYNNANTSEHRNLADAFDLALMYGRIVKYSNARDELILEQYGENAKLGLAKSQEFEHNSLDKEHNLWSN